MTEIHIRDLTLEGSLVYYTITVTSGDGTDWIYDGHSTTLEGAYKSITHNLKWDYREFERDMEDSDAILS